VAELRAARPGDEVAIIGAGIGGLTLALALHRANIACRVYEAAAEIRPLGVGINVLPRERGLAVARRPRRARAVAVVTREAAFFNRFGQHVYSEPPDAGPATMRRSCRSTAPTCRPSCSTLRARIGAERVVTGHACVAVDGADDARVRLRFHDPAGAPNGDATAAIAVGCDGIHSALRKQLYPDEGPPRWSGVNMWRGVVPHEPFLSGATMVRAGWLSVGKMVIYPIRHASTPRTPARQLGRRARVRSRCGATGARAVASTTFSRVRRLAPTGSTSPN
jgi:2-polyprenyl-6-methoxyphenol hydroxylase-like FAD-dependent oxidoreductase